MLINRRTILLGGLAAAAAACTSTTSAEQLDAQIPISVVTGQTVSLGQIEAKANPPQNKVPASIVMIGDSITALSEATLKDVLTEIGFAKVTINAEPNRRIEVGTKKPMPGLAVIKYIAASSPPEMWVVALGTNDAGLYTKDTEYQGLIDDTLAAIPGNVPLVWVSAYRHDQLPGCAAFNLVLRDALKHRGHATVGEWNQQCASTKESILTHDGVHPNANGILVFADTVRAGISAVLT